MKRYPTVPTKPPKTLLKSGLLVVLSGLIVLTEDEDTVEEAFNRITAVAN